MVCAQLWEQFQQTNDIFLALVERKYANGSVDLLLQDEVREASTRRQQAKQSILLHEQRFHIQALATRANQSASPPDGA